MPRIKSEQRERFGAIRNGELSNEFGLAPRDYNPAWQAAIELGKRQAQTGICPTGQHSCEDIGLPNKCCSNDDFCFISNITDSSGAFPASCCAVGNDCASSNPCDAIHGYYLCIQTITLTVLTSLTLTSTPTLPPTTTTTSCCLGPCENSAYLCPQSLGGGCCNNGQSCMPNTQCGSFVAPPTTVATMQDPNCSVGQFSCGDGEGGCCANGAVCTVVSNEGRCASASATPTGNGNPGNLTTVIAPPSAALSSGAKAGIGIGVTLAALFILALTFLFIRRRRRATLAARSDTASTVLQPGVAMTDTHTSPGTGGTPGRTTWRRGGAVDYFGPRATAGPYTEGVEGEGESPGMWARPVPVSPQGPGDIVPAVEIGGRERETRPELLREGEGSAGSGVAGARGHVRGESRQLEEVGTEEGGVEAAPAYDEATTGSLQESHVECAPSRRARAGTIGEGDVGEVKDMPEDPSYRHELP